MEKRIGVAARKFMSLPTLLASASLLAGAGVADAGSLEDSIRAALHSNPEIGVVKADRRAVDQELRLARSQYLPSVDLRAATGPEFTNSVGTRRRTTRPPDGDASTTLFRSEAQLRLSQMLFDGFAVDSEVERQRARVDSSAYRVHEAAEFIGLDAIEAHLDILRNEEILALNERNVQQHESILLQVRDLEQSGRGDIADVRQAEARLSRAQDNQVIARGNLFDAIATYQRVVGERPSDLGHGEPPVAAVPPSPEDAAGAASVNSPTVMIAAADVDVAAAELRAARSGFYPHLDLELGSTAGENLDGVKGGNVDASALLVMRYNIFRGGGDMALEREAFHRVNEARAQLQNARRIAEEDARLSYNALETARSRTVAIEAKAQAQRRTRDAYASQFEIGQRDLLDVLDAENELFLDRVSLVTSQYTEEFAVYRVLAVVGDLLNTFDVARPRENVTIYRGEGDVQTPEAIERKSEELIAPDSEPRPLRGEEAGEPPADAMDISPFTGKSDAVDSNLPVVPEEAPKAAVESETSAASTVAGGAATYTSFDEFWANVAGSAAETEDGPVVADDAVATARAGDVAVEPASSEVVASAEDSSGEPPADYGSFDSFFASVFGTSDAVSAGGERVVVTTTSSQPVPLTAGVDVEEPVEPAYQLQGGAGKPARYDSFDSFISSVFGSSSN
ncbi:MAG: TolC family outer membrane protein [Geminicoccaceae bacterium]|nr:TolC family outer membrane protein [Geminicoccaceae bacterium]